VGDIALLEPGEVVPCDGIFISGHNVKCDESGATGESDAIKKASFAQIVELYRHTNAEHAHKDCFIISGSKVLEGVGKYVIVAVGNKSFNGRIMMGELCAKYQESRHRWSSFSVTCTALRGDTEHTPLQLKLNYLAELIAKIGSAAGLTLFTALMIRFFVQLGTGEPSRYANMLNK
jgi:P-type Ca2+ transporter type 2C